MKDKNKHGKKSKFKVMRKRRHKEENETKDVKRRMNKVRYYLYTGCR